ncbi:lysozyme inhibitor LprI family protein [Janthinobacterium sp.]|uniref:lysozyme inhibitor LprI family protein n=1 Tax=Janthinobacterium sp. TaxID=1871054 RepID=UPI00293D6147|nr:lysozyme inhibitor LprI family protein [Janthinobacterium sp.]
MKPTLAISRLLLAGALAASAAYGADAPVYPNTGGIGDTPQGADWYQQCLRVEKAAPPAGDVPAAPVLAALKACDAQALYYDTRQQPGAGAADWQRVRHCALAQGDDGVLMMLYANGLGVARHPALALKHACSLPGAGAEMSGRVAHLIALGKSGKAGAFDLCDDITSGYMQGVCTAIDERRQDQTRSKQLGALTRNWSAPQKAALGKLQAALDEFARARGERETDLSGTARAAMAIAAQSAEISLFGKDVAAFEKGMTPDFTAAQLAAFDKELNTRYQKIMQLPATRNGGIGAYTTVSKDQVKQTQRAWLKYRDAFVGFGAARYPALPARAWQALLTQRRAQQLAQLAAD